MSRLSDIVRTQALGFVALSLVLTGGVAYAASAAKNSVVSSSIKNGQVKTVDLGKAAVRGPQIAPDAVTGAHLAPDTLTGDDVDESTLGTVSNAAALNGLGSGSFLRSAVVKRESAVTAGTALGDGTFVLSQACAGGEVLLTGGPANVSGSSWMVESFPTPGTTNSWSARINKAGLTDAFSVVILCAGQ